MLALACPSAATDLAFLRGVEAELDSALASRGRGAGDDYVDMATPSADHNACTSDGHPVGRARRFPPRAAYPLHPDAAGMAGMAAVLEGAMETGGTR